MSFVIELGDLKKYYTTGKTTYHALKGVDLSIENGEFIAIMGSSGAGKSTLMNILGLLDHPSQGYYRLDGRDVSTLSDNERSVIRNLKIGFVFQSFFLLPRLTVLQNAELPLVYREIKSSKRRDKVLSTLQQVGMQDFIHRKPNELSGGQMQRVAIARALAADPSVILADEPTGALDSNTGQGVMDLFKTLNEQEGVTIVIVTHDNNVANQCRRIVHVKDGLIYEETGGT